MGDSSTELLVVLILTLLYTVCLGLLVVRSCRIWKIPSLWTHAKIFYLVLFLQMLIRIFTFLLILTNFMSFTQLGLFFAVTVSDSLVLIAYMLLVWKMVALFFLAHISFSHTTRRTWATSTITFGFRSVLMYPPLLWACWELIALALLLTHQVESIVDSELNGLANITTAVAGMLTLAFLGCYFSGSPVQSSGWKRALRRMMGVMLLWSLARVFTGLFQLIGEYSEAEMSDELITNHSISLEVGAVAVLKFFIGEVTCFLIVLDSAYISIFESTEQSSGNEELLSPQRLVGDEEYTVLNTLPSAWGSLSLVQIAEHPPLIFRRLEFPRLSQYVIEEFRSEYDRIRQLKHLPLVPLKGIYVNYPVVGIFSEYCAEGSLFDYFRNKVLVPAEQRHLAYALAKALSALHKQQLVHGCLSSKNVLLRGSELLIGDFGFLKLKKYASVIFRYSTKSAWSSPQVLIQPRPFPSTVTMQDDVYSFGIILYEIMTQLVPFAGFTTQELVQQVGHENCVLNIPRGIPHDAARVMVDCWHMAPEQRPSMKQVKRRLKSLF